MITIIIIIRNLYTDMKMLILTRCYKLLKVLKDKKKREKRSSNTRKEKKILFIVRI